MPSSSAKLASVCCALFSPRCVGISFQSGRAASECPCLQWSEVYGDGGIDCNPGIGGLAGGEFCTFMRGLHSNVCVEQDFMSQPGLSASVCYVSGECTGEQGMTRKTCAAGSDTLLTDMSIAATTSLASAHGVDQGCLAGYGTVYVEKLAREVTEADIDAYQATGIPYFIWSMRDHFAPRLEIRGTEVYRHDFSPDTPGFWTVTCLEGCSQ